MLDFDGDDVRDLFVGDVTWQQSTPKPLIEAAEKKRLEDGPQVA